MKVIEPSVWIKPFYRENILGGLERVGRTCYKSEHKITENSSLAFTRMLRDLGHTAMLEHAQISVKFIIDRGVSHELVRHRLVSFAQESTRYVNYKGGVTFIRPFGIAGESYDRWKSLMAASETAYEELIEEGLSPQWARSVLPNSVKTEIWVTANPTEWRHIFKLRADKAAHPQMRQVMIPLLLDLQSSLPELFDDLTYDMNFPLGEYAWIYYLE